VGSSRALLRACAQDDARRREIQEIHDAAGAAVHLISSAATAVDTRGDQELRALERDHIVRVLADLRGNKLAAAKRLGISRRTLYRRLARHGLRPQGSGL
jgi:transcriptional regulator of acetoin/glycerol metabolism